MAIPARQLFPDKEAKVWVEAGVYLQAPGEACANSPSFSCQYLPELPELGKPAEFPVHSCVNLEEARLLHYLLPTTPY